MENTFLCTSCGACCRKLLVHLNGERWVQQGTFGLLLLPGEERLFLHTAPMWRSGQEILAYQTVEEPCPHWTGSECRIYERRPRACRAYPASWQVALWRVDTKCPQVAALGRLVDYRDQILAAHDMMRFQRWLYGTHSKLEYFDLAERRWQHA